MSGAFSDQFQMTRPTYNRVCQCCGAAFIAGHPGAKWCSSNCTMRAYQRRRRGVPESDPGLSLVAHSVILEDPDELPQAWRMPVAFEGHQVRIITDDQGVAWFVATDVCSVLGIGNPRQATTRLDADEKGVISTDTPGGRQSMTVVNEPGLYSLILCSRKPDAKRFKRWVTHEVLPAIRRTGSYATRASTPALPCGIHVVATSPRHANWLWLSAVEEQVSAAIGGQIGKHRDRVPVAYQLHLSA